ncbi:hypothetical protein HGRIS_005320 [Hohenbuehelia grisea]|uniref:Transcription factor domain-containing protein n=1 Tax=Hohenbuehelia grisea TaxID=104357 RepID=A0ABR3JEV6_9AGAR
MINILRIKAVLENAESWGLFLHPRRLRAAGALKFPVGDPNHCSPALIQTMAFVGQFILFHKPMMALHDDALLHTACLCAACALFIAAGDLNSASYQVSQARFIVVAARLNAIPSVTEPNWNLPTKVPGTDYLFPPPADLEQQQERINAFWAVFNLVGIINVLVPEIPLSLGDIDQITTPWPGTTDKTGYALGAFVNGAPFPTHAPYLKTTAAFQTRAAAILHQVVKFSTIMLHRPSQDTATVRLHSNTVALINDFRRDWTALAMSTNTDGTSIALGSIALSAAVCHLAHIMLVRLSVSRDANLMNLYMNIVQELLQLADAYVDALNTNNQLLCTTNSLFPAILEAVCATFKHDATSFNQPVVNALIAHGMGIVQLFSFATYAHLEGP